VKSTEIALEKAAAEVKGSVLASDAFFPFSWGDSVEMACKVSKRGEDLTWGGGCSLGCVG
jgi:AICAR transformylase/IMP cyclohydrolase PurH